jgi:pullulanase
LNSTRGFGRKGVRDGFGSTLIRYAKLVDAYDPVTGQNASVSPGRRCMLAQLERWMRDYHIDGLRMDSVGNAYNWDFVGEFKDRSRELWRERWNAAGLIGNADARFLVVGEELPLSMGLLTQNRLDALWDDKYREYIRSALLGLNAEHENFDATVRKAVDCRRFGFSDGAKAVNYLTAHDVEGFRKERLWTLFDRSGVGDLGPRKKRIKLAFACLLTAVGIAIILAGEEFGGSARSL